MTIFKLFEANFN